MCQPRMDPRSFTRYGLPLLVAASVLLVTLAPPAQAVCHCYQCNRYRQPYDRCQCAMVHCLRNRRDVWQRIAPHLFSTTPRPGDVTIRSDDVTTRSGDVTTRPDDVAISPNDATARSRGVMMDGKPITSPGSKNKMASASGSATSTSNDNDVDLHRHPAGRNDVRPSLSFPHQSVHRSNDFQLQGSDRNNDLHLPTAHLNNDVHLELARWANELRLRSNQLSDDLHIQTSRRNNDLNLQLARRNNDLPVHLTADRKPGPQFDSEIPMKPDTKLDKLAFIVMADRMLRLHAHQRRHQNIGLGLADLSSNPAQSFASHNTERRVGSKSEGMSTFLKALIGQRNG